ncbi:MAG: hypothetical protein LLF84_02970 [Methanoregulaceae archaeon]|nr:hypothetical protein [Methanoregulaceae archaeon]
MNHPKLIPFEQYLNGRGIRVCGVFADSGRRIFELEENALRQFPFTEDHKRAMKHQTLIYNDAQGDFPSKLFTKDIIDIAIEQDLAELRVVTKSGTYSLAPRSHPWPSSDRIFTHFYRNLERIDDTIFDPEDRKIVDDEGRNYLEDRSWYLEYYVWKKVADELGLIFTRDIHPFHLECEFT